MYFECVVDRAPNVRPWKAPLNERILSFGAPGGMLIMQEFFSCSVRGALPRSLFWYLKTKYLQHVTAFQQGLTLILKKAEE